MKKITIFTLLLFFNISIFAENISIPPNVKFQNNARVVISSGSINERGKVGSINYNFYHSDSSAAFDAEPNALTKPIFPMTQRWMVSCEQDSMTDKKTCSVSHLEGKLSISRSKNGIETISVIGTEYPGTVPKIRIGNSKPMSAKIFLGKKARKIYSLLKVGTIVRTQYYDWPYHASQEGKLKVYGLKEAMLYVDWVLKGNHQTQIESNLITPARVETNTLKGHSHDGRIHTHPLPESGVHHRHGSGAIGK